MSNYTSGPWKRVGLEIRGAKNELIAIAQTFGSYETAIKNADYIVQLFNKKNEKEKCGKGKKR